MRVTTLFNKLLNLQGLRVTGVRFEDDVIVIAIRRTFRLLTCPHCGRRRRGRESCRKRAWRHIAIWGHEVRLEGETRRLRCRKCKLVVTEAVPWARHGSDFTKQFEDAVGLLAQQTNQTAVARFTGVSWVTVGSIARRIVAEHLDPDRGSGSGIERGEPPLTESSRPAEVESQVLVEKVLVQKCAPPYLERDVAGPREGRRTRVRPREGAS